MSKSNCSLKSFYLKCVSLLLFSLPSISFASNYDSSDPVSNLLQHLVDLLTNTWMHVIAVLAIATIGYMTISLGKIPRTTAIAIVMGITVVLGAAKLATLLGFI